MENTLRTVFLLIRPKFMKEILIKESRRVMESSQIQFTNI